MKKEQLIITIEETSLPNEYETCDSLLDFFSLYLSNASLLHPF